MWPITGISSPTSRRIISTRLRPPSSLTDSAAPGARVVQHLFERDGDGRVVAKHDVTQRVADENDVRPCLVNDARGRVVVCGQAYEAFAALLAGADGGHGHFFGSLLFEIGHLKVIPFGFGAGSVDPTSRAERVENLDRMI